MKLRSLLPENNQLLTEASSYEFTTDVAVEVNFPQGAKYKGRQPSYRFNTPDDMRITYEIEFDIRRWGLGGIWVGNVSGPSEIEFELEVEDIVKEHVVRPAPNDPDYNERSGTTIFKGKIDWDKVDAKRGYPSDTDQIMPNLLVLEFDRQCKFEKGTLEY